MASKSASNCRGRHVDADVRVGTEFDTLDRHLRHAPVDQVLLHLEIGDAVAQAARRCGPPSRTARRRDPRARVAARRPCPAGPEPMMATRFPVLRRRRLRRDPAFVPALVDDEMLDRLDADGVVVDVERARRLARRGTDAPGELGKIIGRMQHVERVAPLVPVHEVVPVGDDVVDRATRLAERDAAIHAARALLRRVVVGQREHELAIVTHPFGRGLHRFLDALQFEKAR